MKNTWITLALAAALSACSNNANTDTELSTGAVPASASGAAMGYYGKKIDESNAITADEMLKQLETKDSVFVKVKAPVEASCQKKGCWMDVQLANGQSMKVRFKDYAFFVPVDTTGTTTLKGKTAVFEGYAHKELISVPDLRHYAEDAGMTKEEIEAINKPEEQYTFMADGVILKD